MTAATHAIGHPSRTPHAAAPYRTRTGATDPDDAPVVHWPEPSPLQSWWNTIMNPSTNLPAEFRPKVGSR